MDLGYEYGAEEEEPDEEEKAKRVCCAFIAFRVSFFHLYNHKSLLLVSGVFFPVIYTGTCL